MLEQSRAFWHNLTYTKGAWREKKFSKMLWNHEGVSKDNGLTIKQLPE